MRRNAFQRASKRKMGPKRVQFELCTGIFLGLPGLPVKNEITAVLRGKREVDFHRRLDFWNDKRRSTVPPGGRLNKVIASITKRLRNGPLLVQSVEVRETRPNVGLSILECFGILYAILMLEKSGEGIASTAAPFSAIAMYFRKRPLLRGLSLCDLCKFRKCECATTFQFCKIPSDRLMYDVSLPHGYRFHLFEQKEIL